MARKCDLGIEVINWLQSLWSPEVTIFRMGAPTTVLGKTPPIGEISATLVGSYVQLSKFLAAPQSDEVGRHPCTGKINDRSTK